MDRNVADKPDNSDFPNMAAMDTPWEPCPYAEVFWVMNILPARAPQPIWGGEGEDAEAVEDTPSSAVIP